ncbi:hydroxyethylthiazole kinase [Frigoribacterium sp. RIT-PI-h]|nr:hydroxyethylthiazole kinase [Frigoribacterium sp. RIT-PI-h]
MTTAPALLPIVQAALDELRAREPLVQCITNSVVAGVTANSLLALGAAPAMVDVPVEAALFAPLAGGLLVNLGTPHSDQMAAALEAADAARHASTPWVLDPVAIGTLPVRTALAHRLLDKQPTIVRGNASEILALAGGGAGGRGVDSSYHPDEALEHGTVLARSAGTVVAISGPVDLVTDGQRTVRIANGHPLLTRVTGGGCVLGAVMAAFAAVHDDAFEATVAAVTVYTVAAEVAAERSTGPGTFAVHLLDALSAIDPATVADRAALS